MLVNLGSYCDCYNGSYVESTSTGNWGLLRIYISLKFQTHLQCPRTHSFGHSRLPKVLIVMPIPNTKNYGILAILIS